MNLTHRVTIQQKSASVDEIGQPINTWVDVITVWANIKFLRGIEMVKANQDTAVIQASIRTRKRSGITESMRAVCGGAIYHIIAVLPQNAAFMDLTVERVG